MLHLPIWYLYLISGISINTNRDDGFKTTQRVANPWYLLMLLLLLLLNVYSGKWAWLQLANKDLNKHNILKNPNCREEDQLTICKDDWRVERGSTWREITGFVVRAGLEPATPGSCSSRRPNQSSTLPPLIIYRPKWPPSVGYWMSEKTKTEKQRSSHGWLFYRLWFWQRTHQLSLSCMLKYMLNETELSTVSCKNNATENQRVSG